MVSVENDDKYEGISGFLLCKKEVCRSVYLARKKSSPTSI